MNDAHFLLLLRFGQKKLLLTFAGLQKRVLDNGCVFFTRRVDL